MEGSTVSLFTDKIGLRDIYFFSATDIIVISSHLDTLRYFTELKIDFKVFGTSWMCVNKISHKSLYKNVTRLVRGMKATINSSDLSFKIDSDEWLPEIPCDSEDFHTPRSVYSDFNEHLLSLLSFKDTQMVLGLSGGMDSRILLSVLLKSQFPNWTTHTTGSESDPDRIVATQIKKNFNIPSITAFEETDIRSFNIDKLQEFCFTTCINHPVTSFFSLMNINDSEADGRIFIDGGFGEIWRREFFNALLWNSYKGIKNADPKKIANGIRFERGKIFNNDIHTEMANGIPEQVEEIINLLPPANKIGIENWVDLFAVKTRIPNYYSPEQTRIDPLIDNYMPFLQLSLLNKMLSIPLNLKKNGQLVREIIRLNYSPLTKFPLIKGDTKLPFGFSTFNARLITKIKKKILKSKKKNIESPLFLLKEYALDTVNSTVFYQSGIYNNNLQNYVTEFFKTEREEYRFIIENWLSFSLSESYSKKQTPKIS